MFKTCRSGAYFEVALSMTRGLQRWSSPPTLLSYHYVPKEEFEFTDANLTGSTV